MTGCSTSFTINHINRGSIVDQQPGQSNSKSLINIVPPVLLVILTVAGILLLINNNRQSADSTGPSTSQQSQEATRPTEPSGNAAPSNASFKNGSYQATGSYNSPGGRESIDVSLTLEDNIVTAVTVKEGAKSPTSRQYQGEFIDGYKSQVVGKNIEDISLSRVSGSSLTSRGFNDALDTIRDQSRV